MDYTNTKEPKKVIDGLKICSDTSRSCFDDNCPYYKSYTSCQKNRDSARCFDSVERARTNN